MSYDDSLAARVRRTLKERTNVVEKRMFGGLTFMVAGNMCRDVNHDDLILRLDRKTVVADLDSPYVRAWDFMKLPMKGIFAVGLQGCGNQKAVDHWVKIALKHTLTLRSK